MKRITFLACLFVPIGLSQAQPFLKNGDFSQGANGMQYWTGSGNGGSSVTGQDLLANPVTEKFDTNGGGPSPAFSILPGRNRNPQPNPQTYTLQQAQVLFTPGPMEMHMDVCAICPNSNGQGPYMKIMVAGQQVVSWTDFKGYFTAGTYRRHLTFVFTPPKSGPQTLTLEFWRDQYIWVYNPPYYTPKLVIDNIYLGPAQQPVLRVQGERKLGGTLALELEGKVGNAAGILLGLRKGPGLAIPGFTYTLQLDPTILIVLLGAGSFGTTGTYTLKVPVPNDPALGGYPLPFQGLGVGAAGGNFGLAHTLPLYP